MRLKKIALIRKKLQNDELTIGTWQQIPHSSISEILGQAGYDWVAIDMEHGSINFEKLPDLFRGIELGGALPIVRVAESNMINCKKALDAGAGGIIAPMIENAEQLKSIIDYCCWPPSGNRGVGYSRANLFGKHFDEYNKEAQAPLIIAQIEHIEAVNNLNEILKVKGLDAIIVGPYDLSASINKTAEFDHLEFLNVMNKIKEICKRNKIPYGDHVVQPDNSLFENRVKEGYRFIAYGTDGVFLYNSSISPKLK